MRAMLKAVLVVFVIALLLPGALLAATIDDVVRLANSGVSDDVILALLDRDKTIFALGSDDLLMLRRRGVSEKVVLAMLKSGRAEAEAALQREDAERAAGYASADGPTVIIVGHGPDRPNTPHIDGFYSGPFLSYGGPNGPQYGAYYGSYLGPYYGSLFRAAPQGEPAPPARPAMCLAQSFWGPTRSVSSTSTTITPCPDVVRRTHGKLAR